MSDRQLAPVVLDPVVLRRMSGLHLVARHVVDGFLSGLHRSNFRGFNVEFAEHRPYMPGDEPRTIDWKLWAKTDRLHIKRYEEETSLRATLLVDVSASMDCGAERLSKLEYARYLAASLACMMLSQQDAVGLAYFTGELERYVPPRSGMSHVRHLLRHLETLPEAGGTDFSTALSSLAFRFRRRGLLIVISDLIDDPAAVLTTLQQLRHRRHEVIVFHLLDPAEMDFPYQGDTLFRDPETGQELRVTPSRIRRFYREALERFQVGYRQACLQSSIDYVAIRTDTPFDVALARYLERRGSMKL